MFEGNITFFCSNNRKQIHWLTANFLHSVRELYVPTLKVNCTLKPNLDTKDSQPVQDFILVWLNRLTFCLAKLDYKNTGDTPVPVSHNTKQYTLSAKNRRGGEQQHTAKLLPDRKNCKNIMMSAESQLRLTSKIIIMSCLQGRPLAS